MSEILDDGFTMDEKKVRLCARFRKVTLIFTGLCLLLFFAFKIQHWPGGSLILGAGLVAILIQQLACLLAKRRKAWFDFVYLTALIILTLYILHVTGIMKALA